jgi:putative RNase toxin 16 of polymorphic toxin system
MRKALPPAWALALILSFSAGSALAQDIPPPGDCTAEQHRTLQNAVDAACKISRRCDGTQDCATLQSNHGKNLACADARDTINITCFRGGNDGHRQAADDARRAAARCSSLLVSKKCKDCP